MNPRPLKFKLHFNRINMQRGNPNIWTVHTSKACIPARHVVVQVPIEAIYKGPEAPQPRAFLVGRGQIDIQRNGTVVIR